MLPFMSSQNSATEQHSAGLKTRKLLTVSVELYSYRSEAEQEIETTDRGMEKIVYQHTNNGAGMYSKHSPEQHHTAKLPEQPSASTNCSNAR